MKTFYAYCAVVILLLVFIGAKVVAKVSGNMDLLDMVFRFDHAIIAMPDGTTISGKVEKWSDGADGDTVQVTIDGKVYLTHYENAVLIAE